MFNWSTATFILLHIVHGCFHAASAELSHSDKGHTAHETKIFSSWPFTEKIYSLHL